jgi:hypothetical protein
VRIAKPDPIRVYACRRVEPGDACVLESLREAFEVFFERAERQMPEFLARSLANRAPGMRVSVGIEGEDAVAFANLEAELAIEISSNREIGDDEMETINGMNAELAGAAAWADKSFDCRHRVPPEFPEFNPQEKIFAT